MCIWLSAKNLFDMFANSCNTPVQRSFVDPDPRPSAFLGPWIRDGFFPDPKPIFLRDK
jgi:hypothetical protein